MDNSSSLPQHLKIIHWNCNGVFARIGELKNLLSQLPKPKLPHVICLQETRLKPSKIFTLPNYKIFRKDRPPPSRGGGLITAVLNELTATESITDPSVEAIIIRLALSGESTLIANLYNPPNSIMNIDYLKTFIANRKNVVIVGDLNAHNTLWSAHKDDRNGIYLENFLEDNKLTLLNHNTPTHKNVQGNDTLIDLSIVSHALSFCSSYHVFSTTHGSDHYPIEIIINKTPRKENLKTNKYNYPKANWELFQTTLIQNDPIIDPIFPIESLQNIVKLIKNTADLSIPKKNSHCKIRNVPYWNDKCQRAIRRRNAAHNKLRFDNCQTNKIEYKKRKAEAQRTIRSEQKTSWTAFCSTITLKTKAKTIWNMARKMTGHQPQQSIPSLTKDNHLYENDAQKANILASHFADASKDANYSEKFRNNKENIKHDLNNHQTPNPQETDFLNSEIKIEELTDAIHHSKKSTTPGEDGISYEIIKKLPYNILNKLLVIYNALWKHGDFPQEWRSSIVIPILKQGKPPTDPNSYRPISLTSCLCKIFERIVANRLNWYLEKHQLLKPEQTGFRKHKNTIDQLIRLQDSVVKSLKESGYTYAIFLDFSKAFDMVWIEGLLYKIRNLNIHGNIYTFIENFLTRREFKVKVGNSFSPINPLNNGVPQGSVLAPLLFIIMLNDFPTLSDPNISTSLYADDSAIWKSGRNLTYIKNSLQSSLNKIIAWSDNWGFNINPEKTVPIIFTRKTKYIPNIRLYINNKELENYPSVKFLGIHFDAKLRWKEHLTHLTQKSKQCIALLASISSKSWGASKETLLTIYKSLIRSRLDYGNELFISASKALLQSLDSIQNRCLAIICGTSNHTALFKLQQECGDIPLSLHREKSLLKHSVRILASHNNPAISCLHETWHDAYYHPDNIFSVVTNFKGQLDKYLDRPTLLHFPPWEAFTFQTDEYLSKISKKQDIDPDVFKNIALDYLEIYKNSIHIYTDGSKLNNGATALGIFSKELNTYTSLRLTNNDSVFDAELRAIYLALELIREQQEKDRQYLILTDSLSALRYIKTLTQKELHKIDTDIISSHQTIIESGKRLMILWIPSHVNITGNETADQLAKQGTLLPEPPPPKIYSTKNILKEIDNYILQKWQSHYDNIQNHSIYRLLEPIVSIAIKFKSKSRRIETLATRLKTESANLNNLQFKRKTHPTGLCDQCQVVENVHHFIMECPKYNLTASYPNKTLQELLQNHQFLHHVYDTLQSHNRLL
jgi:ribonuclease HI